MATTTAKIGEVGGEDTTFHFLLMSDLHCDHPSSNLAQIKRDLEWARLHNARVAINGDIIDARLPGDHKRFHMSATARTGGTDSQLNKIIDIAADVLMPYADLIDMMGSGNHETAVQKYHGLDVISILIDRLRANGGAPQHGGYDGMHVLPFAAKAGGWNKSFKIYRHHGFGGSAPVTKYMIPFHRVAVWTEGFDMIWLSHKHARGVDHTQALAASQSSEPHIKLVDRWRVMSGAYMTEDVPDINKDGTYTLNWARERGFSPEGYGGVKLTIRADKKHSTLHSEIGIGSSGF